MLHSRPQPVPVSAPVSGSLKDESEEANEEKGKVQDHKSWNDAQNGAGCATEAHIGYRKSKSNIWIATVVRQCLEGKYCRCLLTCGLHECSSMVLIGAAHMTVGAVPKETK